MIAIPIDKPNSCWDCFNADCNHWGEHGYDNSADCPLLDIVACGECKHEYSCGQQIKRNGLTLKLTCCEYGERRADGDI